MCGRLGKLKKYLENCKNMSNFGRSLLVKDPELHGWVLEKSLDVNEDAGFNERVYCLANGLEGAPRDLATGERLKFKNYTYGYRKLTKGWDPLAIPAVEEPLTVAETDWLRTNVAELLSHFPKFMIDHPKLFGKINYITREFGEARFTERLYCVLNGITERPSRRFVNFYSGYHAGKIREKENARLIAISQRVGSQCPSHGSKVNQFLIRNRKLNARLYDRPADAEGSDFVVCPVLGIRTLNIKKKYVEGILLMPWAEFIKRFPGARTSCSAHGRILSAALAVEGENGLSRHAASIKKTFRTMREVGPDGLTGRERSAQKTRQTHLRTIDENGLNGYQRLARYRNETICENGLSIQINALMKRELTSQFPRGASRESAIALRPVIEFAKECGLKYYFDDTEYAIASKHNYYYFDLVIPALEVAVEYQGKAFHPCPLMSDEERSHWRSVYTNKTADEVDRYDQQKARALFESRGYRTWYVWKTSSDSDVELLLSYLKEAVAI